MCGIAGYLHLSLADADGHALLGRMADTLLHRGPDGGDAAIQGPAGLTMRRLAIVDLPGGHQPMAWADGRFTIVFNGEIYNHRDLRRDLTAAGIAFVTDHSDTEVLLAAFAHWGVGCLDRVNGMFAFAVWDARDRRLTIARDRLGVKPLYYAWDGNRLLFASEMKAMMVAGGAQRTVDPEAIWDYLTFRYVPQPETVWREIKKLPPGHLLEMEIADGRLTPPAPRRWWDIPYTETTRAAPDSLFEQEFSSLFTDAVRLRMLADVRVGILLSGGLDSSAVAAAAREAGYDNVSSFSVAFADPGAVNELPWAREVASNLGLNHHETVISERQFVDFLPDFVRFTDEPLADLASVPLYYICRLAREEVKVVLSGEGSDEILAGYTFDHVAEQWEALKPRRNGWRRFLPAAPTEDFRHADQRGARPPPHMTNSMSSEAKLNFLKTPGAHIDSMEKVAADIDRCRSPDGLNQILYSYSQSWLVEDLLMKADKMSMANSIELRTPFLDYRLVEWAAQLPTRLKVGRGTDGNFATKRILRQYARNRLPASIIDRPKQGFPVPVYGWLSTSLRDFAFDLLAPGCRLEGLAQRSAIATQLAAGTQSDATMPDRHRLWHSLILELWLREWEPAA